MAMIARDLIYPSRKAGRGYAGAAACFALLAAAAVCCAFGAASGAGRGGASTAPGGPRAGAAEPYAPQGQRLAQGERADVLFVTDVPETDIHLRGEKVGTTDEKGQLVVKLLAGEYSADARKKGYFSEPRLFKVNTRTTTVRFFMRLVPAPTPTPTPAATPTPTPPADPTPTPTPPPAEAKAVIERYLDPKLSEQVKLEDWQRLLAATYQELSASPGDAALRAQLEFVEGQVKFIAGNYTNALEDFRSALRRAPNYALAWHGAGSVHLANKQWQQAAEAFDRATKLNPAMWLAYRDLGAALNALKKRKEAAAAYARAAELGYKPQGAGLVALAELVRAGRCDEAVPTLQTLTANEPSAEVFTLLGDCYRRQDQRVNAHQAYTSAIRLDGKEARAHAGLGEIELRDGNVEKALTALRTALQLAEEGKQVDRQHVRKLINDAQKRLGK